MTNVISVNLEEIERQINAYLSIHNEYPYLIMSDKTNEAITAYANDNKRFGTLLNDCAILSNNDLAFGILEVR